MKIETKVLLGCMLLAGFSISAYLVIPNYVLPMCDALGVSTGQVSLMFTFIGLGGVVTSFALGAIMGALPSRVIVFGSAFIMAAAFAGFAFAPNLPVLYIASTLFGIAQVTAGIGMAQAQVTLWFVENAGKRIGLLTMASGLLGFVLSPAAAVGIETVGFQVTVVIHGAIVVAAVVLASVLMPPKGAVPAAVAVASEGEGEAAAGSVTVAGALRSAPFWLILIAIIVANISVTGLANNASTVYQSMGSTAVQASLCISLYSVTQLAASPLFGAVVDKSGPSFAVTVFGIAGAMAFVTALLMSGFVGSAITGALSGILAFSSMVAATAYPKKFGAAVATTLIGLGIAGQNLGAMCGAPVAAFIYDATGSYDPFLVLAIALMAFCVIAVSVAIKMKLKES